ncbi:MAG: hypothetical protein HC912_01650, partial [Saprospiraceae bacterium]|nr:hypothetical protein [Saprospiraceae bacterium]
AQLVWTHDFGTNYANLKDVEVRIDPNNKFMGVYCLNSSNKMYLAN